MHYAYHHHHRAGVGALMANVVKAETDYDLEFRATEDEAWYTVCVVLDAVAETLTVKYLCSPEVNEVFSSRDFETEARVEELVARFRPISQQLQDSSCRDISAGTTVCAAHGSGEDDLKFYDAVVEAVDRKPHSFYGGGEECLCTFVICWKDGHRRDTLTSTNIASICYLVPATQSDPRIRAFAEMAKKMIRSSKFTSELPSSIGLDSNGPPNGKKKSCLSVVKEESPQNRPLESGASLRLKSPTYKSGEKNSNYIQRRNQDEDMGPRSCNYIQRRNQDEDMGLRSCNTEGLTRSTHGHFLIPINNLEKDLFPSSMKSFIYEKTNILSEARVFLRQLSEPFARGVIMVDSQKKAQTVHEFLDNPNHLVVSSRGRPWVITEKASEGILGVSKWNLFPENKEETTHERSCGELEVVVSGTESYKTAELLKGLTVEFLDHESQISKKLTLAEKKILLGVDPA